LPVPNLATRTPKASVSEAIGVDTGTIRRFRRRIPRNKSAKAVRVGPSRKDDVFEATRADILTIRAFYRKI
jgi:hypothetical protein